MKASLLQWGFFLPLLQILCGEKHLYISIYKWNVLAYKTLIT